MDLDLIGGPSRLVWLVPVSSFLANACSARQKGCRKDIEGTFHYGTR